MKKKIKKETDFTDVAVYHNLFGWWTDVDCYFIIKKWINEDKDNRLEIINRLGGIDQAVKKLAEKADQCFDANVGITWSYLEDIWNMIIKEERS